jgi:hypothetical protein
VGHCSGAGNCRAGHTGAGPNTALPEHHAAAGLRASAAALSPSGGHASADGDRGPSAGKR